MEIFIMQFDESEFSQGKKMLELSKLSIDDVDYVLVCEAKELFDAEFIAGKISLCDYQKGEIETSDGTKIYVFGCYHSWGELNV